MFFNYIVVGSGIAGLTIANKLAINKKNRILMIERRSHIGGNIYDYYNDEGILVHKYGPHIFHSNHKPVYDYLSQFTEWIDFQHHVLTYVDGNFIPMPITLETINQFYNMNLTQFEMEDFINKQKITLKDIQTSEDIALSKAGKDIYEKFFKNYTTKQWGVDPSKLDTTVISRIPFRFSRDTRYFSDKYQGMPKCGYTKMCKKMIDYPNIKILLNTDYKEIIDDIEYDQLIYTGPIDYFYNYKYGKLKYRSVHFKLETHDCVSFQEAPVVNYPNDYDFTRITEFKKLTGQKHDKTTTMKEFPCDGDEPYYPFPTKEWQNKYALYKIESEKEKKTIFCGRLAEYRYYNMDAVVARALELLKQRFLING